MQQRPVLAIGPANYAGQAHAWAQGVAANLPVQTWSFARGAVRLRGGFAFEADHTIPAVSYYMPVLGDQRRRWLFRRTTHIALDGFQAFYAWYRKGYAVRDATWLADHGWQVALIAHGSEVRDPDAHMQRNPHSLFLTYDDEPELRRVATEARRNRSAAGDCGLPLFVSTPDLLHDVPTATWLPLAVDVSRFAPRPVFEADVPIVLHLPSKRTPPIKGTQFVDPVCRELDRQGVISYLSPEAVPHSQIPALVASADIVIDQLLSASYGVAAVEAMSSGRVVVGHVGEMTRSMMPEAPPIVDATPDDLGEVLMRLVADRAAARELAGKGVDFVRTWHDGRASARALAGFLQVDADR